MEITFPTGTLELWTPCTSRSGLCPPSASPPPPHAAGVVSSQSCPTPSVAPPTNALSSMAPGMEEARGGAHPLPSGLPGSTNQRAPCWPSAAPVPLPLPPAPASPNPRWRGPDGGVPGLERGRSFAPCCCLSADSSGAMAREATLRPPAPRAPKPSCRTAVSSTNTALKGRIWCRAMDLCPSGPTRGVSWGRAGGRGLGSLLASVYLHNSLQGRGSAPALHDTDAGAGLPRQPLLQVPSSQVPRVSRIFSPNLSTHFPIFPFLISSALCLFGGVLLLSVLKPASGCHVTIYPDATSQGYTLPGHSN